MKLETVLGLFSLNSISLYQNFVFEGKSCNDHITISVPTAGVQNFMNWFLSELIMIVIIQLCRLIPVG